MEGRNRGAIDKFVWNGCVEMHAGAFQTGTRLTRFMEEVEGY